MVLFREFQSLGLLLAARVLHFVFLQGLLHLCLPLVPGQAAVFTSLAPQVVVMKRAAWDTALAIAFFFVRCTVSTLQNLLKLL